MAADAVVVKIALNILIKEGPILSEQLFVVVKQAALVGAGSIVRT